MTPTLRDAAQALLDLWLHPCVGKKWESHFKALAAALDIPAQVDDALDARRLDWLMRNVSGKEYRRIGIYYADGCTRDLIDAAMEVDDYRASLEKSHD